MRISSQYLRDARSTTVHAVDSSDTARALGDVPHSSNGSLRATAWVRYTGVFSDLIASGAAVVLSVIAWSYAHPVASLHSMYAIAGWWGAGVLAFCSYRTVSRTEDITLGLRYRVQETAEALQLLAWGWAGVGIELMLRHSSHAVSFTILLTATTAAFAIGTRQMLHSLRKRDFSSLRKIVSISPKGAGFRRSSWSSSIKRAADTVIAVALLILAAPLMLCIALAILVDSPGPVAFVQRRVGYRGAMFDIYKFRTMHIHAPRYEPSPISRFDRRITRVGRMLRMTSLDELPQLWNVVRGEMSLVGPRPEMPFIVQYYSDLQSRRLEAIPGITGLWQISAHRGMPIHQNIQYDLDYIHMRSFAVDAAILLHTILFAMRGI